MAEQNPSPQQIGASFVTHYYHTLAKEPEVLFKFYKDSSSISYGSENESSIAPIAGLEHIQAKIASLDYTDCKVKLSVVDSLRSLSGAILVVVLGYLSIAGKAYKKFSQTFVLAEQSAKAYYVMNDVFRYLSDAAPPQISSAPKKQPSVPQQTVTISTPPITAQPPTTSSHIITTIPTSLTQHAPSVAAQLYDNLSDGAPSEADSTAATAGTSVIGVEDSMVLSDSEGLDSSQNNSRKKPKSTGAKSTTSVSSLSTSSSKSEKAAKEQPKENADGKADASSVPAAPPQQPQPTQQEKSAPPKRVKKQPQSPSTETKPQSPAETTTPAAAPTAAQKKNDGPKSYAAAVGGEDYVEPPTPTSPSEHKQHYDGRNKKNMPNGIFVSKLHPQTTTAELENAFSKYGKTVFVKNKAKDHYAFVYFETAEAANAAIADSDTLEIARHTVRIEKRTDKPHYQKSRGGSARRGGFVRRGSSEDRGDGAPRGRTKFFRGRGRGKPSMNGQTSSAAAATTTKDQ